MSDSAPTVLVVDDEPQIRRLLKTGIEMHGFAVIEASTAGDAIREAIDRRPDVVVLDLGLPDADGFSVLTNLRQWSRVPVIVLSVRSTDTEKVRAFECGADDYVTKPFSMAEFVARIKVALKRGLREQGLEPVFTVGDLKIDIARRLVTLGGEVMRLSPKQYRLLHMLTAHAGKVVTYQQLLKEIWGPAHINDVHYLRMFVRKVRNKIEPEPAKPRYLITELGVGYRLRSPDQMPGQAGAAEVR